MGYQRIVLTPVGAAGSATATAYSTLAMQGFVTAIRVTSVGVPNTATIAITEDGGMKQSILALAAAYADGVYNPTAEADTQAGAAVVGSRWLIFLAGSKVKVVVALADAAADAVTIDIYTTK